MVISAFVVLEGVIIIHLMRVESDGELPETTLGGTLAWVSYTKTQRIAWQCVVTLWNIQLPYRLDNLAE